MCSSSSFYGTADTPSHCYKTVESPILEHSNSHESSVLEWRNTWFPWNCSLSAWADRQLKQMKIKCHEQTPPVWSVILNCVLFGTTHNPYMPTVPKLAGQNRFFMLCPTVPPSTSLVLNYFDVAHLSAGALATAATPGKKEWLALRGPCRWLKGGVVRFSARHFFTGRLQVW